MPVFKLLIQDKVNAAAASIRRIPDGERKKPLRRLSKGSWYGIDPQRSGRCYIDR